MKITREVRFTEDEKTEITKAGLIEAAKSVLGEPGEGEEWDVSIRSYGGASVSIQEKLTDADAMAEPVPTDIPHTPLEDVF